ncbi:MAG: stage II sporulation protein D [bacterium]|jgi:stage II sporulation protein D
MRRLLVGIFAFLFFSVIILPSIVVRGLNWSMPVSPEAVEEQNMVSPSIKVFLEQTGNLVEMPLEDYLVGVVAAEMPADFALEALKAQAVAARTFALHRMILFGGTGCERNQMGADVCTDPAHCQGWLSEEELYEKWGIVRYAGYREKISQAVMATAGLVMTYDHQLIDASYHSTCGGHTEDAAVVWGRDVPYLVGVPCPYDADSPRFQEQLSLPVTEVAAILETEVAVPVAGGLGTIADLEVLERTSTGRVLQLRAGEKTFSGNEIRTLLGLRSTHFTWRLEGDSLVFNTIGYGHGVGMCQYGANGMAKAGSSFQEILQYYYTGIAIELLSDY